jgi:hypothetical protein
MYSCNDYPAPLISRLLSVGIVKTLLVPVTAFNIVDYSLSIFLSQEENITSLIYKNDVLFHYPH